MSNQRDLILDAVRLFSVRVAAIDRQLRQGEQTAPATVVKEQVAADFWSMVEVIDQIEREGFESDDAFRQACRDITGPWLYRSRYNNRAYTKPHGYAGDYRMIEWMYDLEGDSCDDPTQPAIVNCLDYVFSTVHSVRSVWERRHWFARLLLDQYRRNDGRLCILDIAAGGARYIQDFLSSLPDLTSVEVTILDQDIAAIEYCRLVSLSRWASQVTLVNLPVKQFTSLPPSGTFDVVISAGLFDYLDQRFAEQLLGHVLSQTKPGGVVAVSNFHPDDPSRVVKSWLADWQIIYRDETALASLFPSHISVTTMQSDNRALTYAVARDRQDDSVPRAQLSCWASSS